MNMNGIEADTVAKARIPVRYRYVKREAAAMPPKGGTLAPHEPYTAQKRDYKKITGGVFLVALMLLIFFSKTIYGYNLPTVTAVKPSSGRLSKLEMSTGVADWAKVENLYAAVGGKIEDVLVKEGEAVTAGQGLYRMSFDRDEAVRKLRELQNNRDKLQNDIQAINLKLEKQSRYMEDLAGEAYEIEDISTDELDSISYKLDSVSLNIRKARDELSDARERYDDGEVREIDVDRARYALQALYLELDELEQKKFELERKLDKQKAEAKESVEERERARQSRLLDYESDVASLKLELQQKNIELDSLSIQEQPYRKALADFESYAVVAAPEDGTVIALGAAKGETIRAEQLVASIGSGGIFEVECDISPDNNFVVAGDVAGLSNPSHTVNGIVTRITPGAQGKAVTIEVVSDEVVPGETFDVMFKKDGDAVYTLVPNGALNQDNDGYFLNQIKRRDGILGKEYYLERLDVYIGDSDSKNTVIVQGITFFEPIAQISDKPVTAGDVISLKNAGDFFES